MQNTDRPTARRLTIEQARIIRGRLEQAREDLAVFLEPDNPDCSVRSSARVESASYLSTWVDAQIEQAIEIIDRMGIEGVRQ